ncbi:MAG: acyl-CoA dehydrogenase domain protein [Myxococcaceae bacterium]|nr:acyl-CoA dehydrogenase domain protein [Myxococcaceae bacterium]
MLDFTEEERMAQQAIRSFCAQHLEPKVLAMEAGELSVYPTMREMAATFGIPDMVRASFARAKEKGDAGGPSKGIGKNAGMMAILTMELSRVCPGFALAFGATLGLFAGGVMARGTLEQKERWALPVLTMDKIGAWGLTEPGAGSDAFGSMKTHAKKAEGGWRISGSKTFITNAPFADVFLIYARLVGDGFAPGDVRAFIVERTDKGLTSGPPMKKMGMHASPTGEVFLDDVFVPDERLLGGVATENARTAAKSSLNQERFGMTPMCLGMVDRCLEESIKYAKEREQWGKPIASFQLVQEKIARIYTARTLMQAMLMRQLEAEKENFPLTGKEASATKLYCARMTTECALEAVQIMGGAGYMTGSVVEMMARDAKLFQIGGGTDEIQILRIARELLEA